MALLTAGVQCGQLLGHWKRKLRDAEHTARYMSTEQAMSQLSTELQQRDEQLSHLETTHAAHKKEALETLDLLAETVSSLQSEVEVLRSCNSGNAASAAALAVSQAQTAVEHRQQLSDMSEQMNFHEAEAEQLRSALAACKQLMTLKERALETANEQQMAAELLNVELQEQTLQAQREADAHASKALALGQVVGELNYRVEEAEAARGLQEEQISMLDSQLWAGVATADEVSNML